MKLTYSLILAAASCGLAFGAATAYTTPVGYVTLGNASGANDLPDNTDIIVSLPLLGPTTAQTTVASVAGQLVNLDMTTLGDVTTVPHMALFENGVSGLVSASTSSSITIMTGTDISSVAATDTVKIYKATTVGNLFADLSSVSVGGGFQIFVNDGSATGSNLAYNVIYTYYGTWYDGSFGDATNVVLFPNEAFMIRNSTGAAIDGLVTTGEVLVGQFQIPVRGEAVEQDTPFGVPTGVGLTLAQLNISSTTNDQILIPDNTTTGQNNAPPVTLQNFGTAIWYDGSFNDVTNTLKLGGGNGYIYRREAAQPDQVFSFTPAY